MRVLTIDLGTSFAKLAVFNLRDGQPRLLHSLRLPSGIGTYDGSLAAIAQFERLCVDLQAAAADCLTRYGVHRLGLTGIREGLVLLDRAARPLWVSGNAVLDGPHLLDLPIGEIAIAGLLPDLLELHPAAVAAVTLQGYLAHRLGAPLALTVSELDAWGLLAPQGPSLAAAGVLLHTVPTVAPGASLGALNSHPGTDLYLAGTDEQASHYGAGLGVTADLSLATATFWSLTAPVGVAAPRCSELRYLPGAAPFTAAASIIGYRWGPYLHQALSGRPPALPARLPRWAVGALLHTLRQGAIDRETLLAAVVADLQAAVGLLAQAGSLPAVPTIAVHGGGLTGLRDFTTEVLKRLRQPWHQLIGDATLRGSCLVGLHSPPQPR